MLEEDLGQGLLVVEKVVERLLRYVIESVVGRGKDGVGAVVVEGIYELSNVQGADQGDEP
jgi:hypothetical protein